MQKRLSLFILCESLGWELMQQRSFVDGLAGNRAPMDPIFGPSAASLPTILTGKLPEQHKHFSWLSYAPEKSPFKSCRWFSYFPQRTQKAWRFQNFAMNVVKKTHAISGRLGPINMSFSRLPQFDFVERKDPLQPGAFGAVRSIIDFYEEKQIPYFRSRHDRTDRENTAALLHLLETRRISSVFFDLKDIAHMVRKRELDSTAVLNQTSWTDRRIRKLYARATELYERVDLFIFSDTGVLPVEKIFDLKDSIRSAGLRYGNDYVAVFEPAMARFWFMNDECYTTLENLLTGLSAGTVLSRQDQKKHGCWFEDKRYGELIYGAHDGVAFIPNDMEAAPPVNLSGYLPGNERLKAGFACNVADVSPPKRIDEIHSLLLKYSAESADAEARAVASESASQ